MSETLKWRPITVEGGTLPYALKQKLVLRIPRHGYTTLSRNTILSAYIDGLRDAGCEGASILSDALEEHHSIELWIAP